MKDFFSFCPVSSSNSSTLMFFSLKGIFSVCASDNSISPKYAVRYAPTLSTLSNALTLTKPRFHALRTTMFSMNGASQSKSRITCKCHAPRACGSATEMYSHLPNCFRIRSMKCSKSFCNRLGSCIFSAYVRVSQRHFDISRTFVLMILRRTFREFATNFKFCCRFSICRHSLISPVLKSQ